MSATKEMEKGRKRYIHERHREAIRRVEAFRSWIRMGWPAGPNLPPIPTSGDFRIAREAPPR